MCHSSPVPQAMNIHLYSDKPWYGIWGVVHYCSGGPGDLLPADPVHVEHPLPAVRLGLGYAVIAGKIEILSGYVFNNLYFGLQLRVYLRNYKTTSKTEDQDLCVWPP